MTIENHNTPAPEERELSEDQQFERMVHDDDSGLFDAGVQMAAPREGVADVDAQPDDLLEKDDQDEGGGHIGEKGENGHQATDDQRVSDDAGGDEPAEPFPGYAQLSNPTREAVDDIITEHARVRNNYKALHGITAPLQRGNAELRRQAEAMAGRIQQLEQQSARQQDHERHVQSTMNSELDEWAKQYPEESQAFTAMMNPLSRKVDALESELDASRVERRTLHEAMGTLHEERQTTANSLAMDVLDASHGDWRQIFNSDDYWQWLNLQSPMIQQLGTSMLADDTIMLLQLYKGNRAPARSSEQPDTGEPNKVDRIHARRKKALQQSASPHIRQFESGGMTAEHQGEELTDEDRQFAELVAGDPLFE